MAVKRLLTVPHLTHRPPKPDLAIGACTFPLLTLAYCPILSYACATFKSCRIWFWNDNLEGTSFVLARLPTTMGQPGPDSSKFAVHESHPYSIDVVLYWCAYSPPNVLSPTVFAYRLQLPCQPCDATQEQRCCRTTRTLQLNLVFHLSKSIGGCSYNPEAPYHNINSTQQLATCYPVLDTIHAREVGRRPFDDQAGIAMMQAGQDIVTNKMEETCMLTSYSRLQGCSCGKQ